MKKLIFIFMVVLSACNGSSNDVSINEKILNPHERYKVAIKELESAKSEEERFNLLSHAATSSFDIEDIAKANAYATELLSLAEKYKTTWNYGNAIHYGNIVLGRIALKNGNVEKAEMYLLAAGKTPGSPQLRSYGPNMRLAMDLLEKGEKDVVVKYLNLCHNFWELGGDKLDFWAFQISKGKMPNFGANLYY